ncbi:transcriptional regulator with XRE-family HTH domain [Streptomyces sp. SAI-208]|uniref:helix-turn-helix transcriptional regulator n=1 Tax=Streptomyces sp. SAI-208 TaxID=2940550 RepID=UPI002476AD84|nr:helix-turn-helix transcriptional regulator [Streptomyces sp. SAI-208]MDH6610221.1 transcriptional regulator with XRE-family HTH domain [Streptomyces sp. SAI-208]
MESERDWERLGNAFAEARKAAGLTQVEVAQRLSVTRTPVQAVERGRQPNGNPFNKITATMRAYARLVGWTEDSPARILRGEEPEPATRPDSATEPEPASDLPMAVQRELRSGRTLDHAVVNLGSQADDDTRLIVVLQGGKDMTEEEIDAAWEKWRKTRRHLQAIPGESDTPQEP